MRDHLGLVQDLTFLNVLIKLQDQIIGKMLAGVDARVKQVMDEEDYKVVMISSAEEYFRQVDRYEIQIPSFPGEVEDGAPVLKAQEHKYPLYLPYTRSVVRLNDLFGEYLELNLSYWQYLLADRADFTLAYQSCDQLLIRLCQLLQSYFYQKSSTFTILQRA